MHYFIYFGTLYEYDTKNAKQWRTAFFSSSFSIHFFRDISLLAQNCSLFALISKALVQFHEIWSIMRTHRSTETSNIHIAHHFMLLQLFHWFEFIVINTRSVWNCRSKAFYCMVEISNSQKHDDLPSSVFPVSYCKFGPFFSFCFRSIWAHIST